MIENFNDFYKEEIESIAKKMCIAAITAPKGRGVDIISTRVLIGEDIKKLSSKMLELGEKYDQKSLLRDGDNILYSDAIVLIGTKIKPLGLKKCAKYINIPCSFNTVDLGIAIGSAVSIAADNRIDNRVMYTIGLAAIELGYFEKDVKIVFGIPLSVMSKNPFFDRA